jgi:Domain of unknown function (DUF2017)
VGDDAAGLGAYVFQPRIERTREGDLRVRLSQAERDLLRDLPAELRRLLEVNPEDPSARRLFPPAYEGDQGAEQEYRRLMRDELLAGRREALRVLEETADRERLTREELDAWLGALNDLRLVLGTRLGVTEELYEEALDPEDPQARETALYVYLTWLQEQLVEAAAAGLEAN